jgi:deoxyribonuclease V
MDYVTIAVGIPRYMPGHFCRRELPCILKLFEQFAETPDEIVIDGYVMFGDRKRKWGLVFIHFV